MVGASSLLLVPSIAIREGVYKSFQVTQDFGILQKSMVRRFASLFTILLSLLKLITLRQIPLLM